MDDEKVVRGRRVRTDEEDIEDFAMEERLRKRDAEIEREVRKSEREAREHHLWSEVCLTVLGHAGEESAAKESIDDAVKAADLVLLRFRERFGRES